MVGREVNSAYPSRNVEIGEEVLRVENLCRKDRKQNVAFSLRKGEVLGIAGLVGAGRTEIMRAIFGVYYISSMDVYVHGQKVKINNPAAAKKHGIAFLTEDRKVEGLTLYNFTRFFTKKYYYEPLLRSIVVCSTTVLTSMMERYADYEIVEIVSPEGKNIMGEEYYEFHVDEEKLDDLILRLFYVAK